MKKAIAEILFLILLITAAAVMLVSCSETECVRCTDVDGDLFCDACGRALPPHTECVDADGDGVCDECREGVGDDGSSSDEPTDPELPSDTPPTDPGKTISLITKRRASFAFVVSDGVSSAVHKKIDKIISSLRGLGVDGVEKLSESETICEDFCRVLVGDFESLGIRGREFGFGGYAVRALTEDSISLSGGSDAALLLAIDRFSEEVLGVTGSETRLTNAVFESSSDEYIYNYTDYRVESLTHGERSLSDYVISIDTSDWVSLSIAKVVSDLIFEYSGYDLKIVERGTLSENIIDISFTERSGGLGFKVDASREGVIGIYCEYPQLYADTVSNYFLRILKTGDRRVSIVNYELNLRDVHYSDFGAKGDGRTDDVDAIRAAHEYANLYGHRVLADTGATYYIGKMTSPIPITTDVDFGDATFIIDDRGIHPDDPAHSVSLFHIAPTAFNFTLYPSDSEAVRELSEKGIMRDEIERIDLGLGYPALIRVINSEHKVYIRTGGSANDGVEQAESVVIDENGFIDPDTPFLMDYDTVTRIMVFPLTDSPINIRGGKFITRANNVGGSHNYYARNILVTRSFTEIEGVAHEIIGEPEDRYDSCPYTGFVFIQNCSYVTFTKCSFFSHKTYSIVNHLGNYVNMGSYDIGIGHANGIKFVECTQPNFFKEDGETVYEAVERWGIMGSNFTKNLTYERCRLNRFDAHCGVVNATLIDSEVEFISIIGGGLFRMEGCTVYGECLIQLRSDYGQSWRGDIEIVNTHLRNTSSEPVLFKTHTWQNHYFGYKTYLPQRVLIDGLTLDLGVTLRLFEVSLENQGDFSGETYKGVENLNPMAPTRSITVKNHNEAFEYILPTSELFSDMIFTLVE